MTYQNILFETCATGIARLTLNRPERLNSFNTEMHAEVRAALDRASRARGARVLVHHRRGTRLLRRPGSQRPRGRARAPRPSIWRESIEKNYKPLVLALRSLPLPVIAAVNGVAAGAGANHRARLRSGDRGALGELRAGVRQARPGAGFRAAPGSCRASSAPRARWGSRCSATSSAPSRRRHWGLIWRCVEDAELVPAVEDAGATVRRRAHPRVSRAPSRPSTRVWGRTLAQQLDIERDYQGELGRSADYAEGVAAFAAKRAPRFTGR